MPRKKKHLKAARRKQPQKQVTLAAAPPCKLRGDHGPQTAAQCADTIIEPVPGDVNRMGRKRKKPPILRMHENGQISLEQYSYAQRILAAYEATQKQPDRSYDKTKVDVSANPTAAVCIQIDRISWLHALIKHMPRRQWEVVKTVVIDSVPLTKAHGTGWEYQQARRRLKKALTEVSDG